MREYLDLGFKWVKLGKGIKNVFVSSGMETSRRKVLRMADKAHYS